MDSKNYLDRPDVLEDIVQAFISKERRKVFGNFRIEGDDLLFCSDESCRDSFNIKDQGKEESERYFAAIKSGRYSLLNGRPLEDLKKEYEEQKKSKAETYFYVTYINHHRYMIAKRINGVVFGNSSVLNIHSNRTPRSREHVQEVLEKTKDVTMVPFSIFTEAKLDINKLQIVEKAPPENVTRLVRMKREWDQKTKKHIETPIYEKVHFTGAALIRCDGKYFLFDIDRNEIKHKKFNPFVAQIPKAVKSIKEAYEILMPKEVYLARRKHLDVKRQGEWFFIPITTKPPIKKLTEREELILLFNLSSRWNSTRNEFVRKKTIEMVKKESVKLLKEVPFKKELKAGANRPNTVELCVETKGKIYCKGLVEHTGREHEPIILKTWHVAVPNTAVKSFTITGDID